jgi:hypothetical protein
MSRPAAQELKGSRSTVATHLSILAIRHLGKGFDIQIQSRNGDRYSRFVFFMVIERE